MRITFFFIVLSILFVFTLKTSAQFNILEKVKKKVNKTIEKNIDEGINKTVDETEKEIKKGSSEEKDKPANEENVSSPEVESESENSETTKDVEKLTLWSKYNFVPGDKIILDDDLSNEESGEFPSRWDLVSGNAENASFGEENIISFDNKTIIKPLMDKAEYLPEKFTIEFDAYFDENRVTKWHSYNIRFWKGKSWLNFQQAFGKDGHYYPLKIFRHGAELNGNKDNEDVKYESYKNSLDDKIPVWRHIALAFNKRSLKVFVDKERVLNIPNLGIVPKIFSIEALTLENKTAIRAIKNIRVAEGGKKLYDRIMAEGKFVTSGILFDVNKATIKPESMGVMNQIVKLMNQHKELNFSIEGHTDSDGDETHNQTLSEKRAGSVKSALINLGINESRLTTKGFGESVTIDNNTTPEGKANNRRVEFVKI